jgi:hypothetical protein
MKYDATVRRLNLFVLSLVIMSCGCSPAERPGTCAPISNVTRVVVQGDFQGTIPAPEYVITDPRRIHQLIAFANARRQVSQPSLYTMPAPRVTAIFYDKADFVSAIGSGTDFFFVNCSTWKGVQRATDAEIEDFKRLIGYSN